MHWDSDKVPFSGEFIILHYVLPMKCQKCEFSCAAKHVDLVCTY